MKLALLALALTFVVAVNAAPHGKEGHGGKSASSMKDNPHVHRYTSGYVTRIHRYTYRIPGRRTNGAHANNAGKGGVSKPHVPHGGSGSGSGSGVDCKDGAAIGAVNQANDAVQDVTGGIASAFGADDSDPTVVGDIFAGAEAGINGAANTVNQAASDFGCGWGRVFDAAGKGLGEGDPFGAALDAGETFVTGTGQFFGDAGANAIGAAQNAVSDAAYGKRGRTYKRTFRGGSRSK